MFVRYMLQKTLKEDNIMSLFDDLSGKFSNLTEKLKDKDLGDKIQEVGNNVADALNIGARTAYGRAKNAAEVSGLKLKLSDAQKAEALAYEKFGRKYMELHKDDADPAFEEELSAIREADQKVAELKKAIEDAKEATAAAEAELKAKVQADREAAKAARSDDDAGDEFSEETEAEETAPEEAKTEEEAPAEDESAGEAPAEDAAAEEEPAEDAAPEAEETPAEEKEE